MIKGKKYVQLSETPVVVSVKRTIRVPKNRLEIRVVPWSIRDRDERYQYVLRHINSRSIDVARTWIQRDGFFGYVIKEHLIGSGQEASVVGFALTKWGAHRVAHSRIKKYAEASHNVPLRDYSQVDKNAIEQKIKEWNED
jgi:hypothetical protein